VADEEGGAWAPLLDGDGGVVAVKVEGIAPGDAPDELWAVTDPDDPDVPGELLVVRLSGPWPTVKPTSP
jgi:hypothetical protein